MTDYDLVVVGAGPAGMAAAIAAYDAGLTRVLLVDREETTGGILNQCIHDGFGLHRFKETLTGPEYAARDEAELAKRQIEVATGTTVLSVSRDRVIELLSPADGYRTVQAGTVILAMGCREQTRGPLAISGTRPAGILTAGAAQRYVNIDGYHVGKRVIIVGSGDIGLIMARRLTLEGASVVAVVERLPYASGLRRNVVQCLDDFAIPLYLSHTITRIEGKRRVTGVTAQKVDANYQAIPGSEMQFDVDTVLLSVGLIPENELSKACGVDMSLATRGPIINDACATSVPGVFACGNVVHVHDLVDYVSQEGARAGMAAARYWLRQQGNERPAATPSDDIPVQVVGDASQVVPGRIERHASDDRFDLFFRVRQPSLKGGMLTVLADDTVCLAVKRKYWHPGEMERLVVPRKLLPDVPFQTLTLKVEAFQ